MPGGRRFVPAVASPFPSNDPAPFSLLDGFRAKSRRMDLHPLERLLLAISALHLCFLPWALGTMHVWSQAVSLGLAAAGFVVSLLPRTYSTDLTEASTSFTLRPVAQLVRFPLFWAGLVFLGYLVVQALNPSARFVQNAAYWWMEPVPSVAWLPSGMSVPFAQAGPWRALFVFGALWLFLCSVWLGLLRRQSLRLLFTIVVANAFLLAGLGIAQQLTGASKIFWSVASSNSSFVASFIYRNHAGAYLNLMLALAGGLAWWHFQRSERRLEKSSPAGLFAFFAVSIGVMVLFSYSRMSTVLLIAFVLCTGGAFFVQQWLRAEGPRNYAVLAGLVLVFGLLVGTGLVSLRVDKVWKRFEGVLIDPVANNRDRAQASNAAGEMFADRWALGWGGGCFRYGFPIYAAKRPEIYYSENYGLDRRKLWEHAHNDLLEFPIEYGVAGMSALLAGLGWLAWRLVRHRCWRNPLALLPALGAGLLLAHGAVDFVFQNPAVLFTWAFLLLAAGRWAELDQPNQRRTGGAN